ncbi:MAG: hypothetical protein NC118_10960 [Eubacterium sp.]|nr:hypothetical protein [Eubacterium sp.]
MRWKILTKEILNEYKSKKEEIKELQYQLKHLYNTDTDTMMGNDTILDYRKGYPVPQAVVGVDWMKIDRVKKRYANRIENLTKECEEVESFIESIPDSLTRRIFRMYYIDNMSQKEISNRIHMDRSRVSRKIDDFIKNAHKAQKAHV